MFVLPPGTSSAAKPTTTPASPARCWTPAFESAKAVATNASSMPKVTPTVACASGPVGVARRRVGGSWPSRKQRPRDTLHPSPDAVAAETPPELADCPLGDSRGHAHCGEPGPLVWFPRASVGPRVRCAAPSARLHRAGDCAQARCGYCPTRFRLTRSYVSRLDRFRQPEFPHDCALVEVCAHALHLAVA